MPRRIAVIFLMLAACSLCMADGGTTCRLTRTRRPVAVEEGLLRPAPVMAMSSREELVWSAVMRGHRVTFRIGLPGESFLSRVEIEVDEQEPVSSMGTMFFGGNREVFCFTPVPVSLGTTRLPLLARLERYRHVSRETRYDPRPSGGASHPGMPEPLDPTKLAETESVPYVSGWDLLVGNAEAFTGKFELKRGRWCTLWLIDADLNGVFGDLTGESGGDLLVWERDEGHELGGISGARRGVSALAPEVRIAGKSYAVRQAAEGPDTILIELTTQ